MHPLMLIVLLGVTAGTRPHGQSRTGLARERAELARLHEADFAPPE